MEINTKYHGVKYYEEKDIITFKKGLPGFEHLKKFILFSAEENNLFYILHSIEDRGIGLVMISPFYSVKDYEFKLDGERIKELKIASQEEVLVLNTVTVNSKVENITVNLKAPVIININEKIGEQLILDNPNYSIKYPLFKGGA